MNSDEIPHILKHRLANSRARFLGAFASDKHPPLNSIQSLVLAFMSQTLILLGNAGPPG